MEATQVQTLTLLSKSQVSQPTNIESGELQKISEADYSQPQVIRRKVKQHEQHIAEQQKTIQRLRKHNEKLKQQLKELNNSLTVMIEKNHSLPKEKKQQNELKKAEVMRRQLDNCKKQIANYQKQVQSLKAKLQASSVQRTVKLQNELKETQMKLQVVYAKVRLLEKTEKISNTSDLGKMNQQLSNKVNCLTQQIGFLKKKVAEAKKSQEQKERILKQRNQHILGLQMKSKQVSKPPKEKSEKVPEKNTPQQTEVLKLMQNIQSLEYSKQVLEKKLKTDLQSAKAKLKSLEQQNQQLKDRLNNKEKQLSITNFKLNDIRRKGNITTLQPIDMNFRRSLDISQHNFERRKESKGLTPLSGSHRKFDDSLSLGIQKVYKITKMTWTWFQQFILSLTTQYQILSGTKQKIQSFSIQHQHKHVNTTEIVFQGYQYISMLQGLCNKHIECLKITTSRGTTFIVGSNKNQPKCKRLQFDIRNNQKPIAVMGIVDNKKLINGQFSDVLVSFGLQIKKKQVVFGKQPSKMNSNSRPNLSIDTKKSTKSALEQPNAQSAFNDKNIVSQEDAV